MALPTFCVSCCPCQRACCSAGRKQGVSGLDKLGLRPSEVSEEPVIPVTTPSEMEWKNPINSIKMQKRKEKSPLVIQSGGGQSTAQALEVLGLPAPGPNKLSLQGNSQCFAHPGQARKVLKQPDKGQSWAEQHPS